MDDMADTSHGWIAWTAAALLASLAHELIDSHIGLYGQTSSQMSLLQAANVFLTSLIYGWWLYAVGVASTGNKSALVSALVIVVVWVLLANGVAAVAVSTPPSSAFPYQDIAHFSCIVLGVGASAAIWRARFDGGGGLVGYARGGGHNPALGIRRPKRPGAAEHLIGALNVKGRRDPYHPSPRVGIPSHPYSPKCSMALAGPP
jgi:hypothetical protein